MKNYKGLTSEQVNISRKVHGTNALPSKKTHTFWDKYWGNFNDPIITILLVALGINILFVFLGKVDWFEAAGILLAVLLSTLVSTFSEYKNETTFQSIQDKASHILCKVYRDGELNEIMIDDIVVGDEVLLQAGDMIPADCEVIEGNISVDQSPLNGENKEVNKTCGGTFCVNTDFWNKHSIYRGTVVQTGECVAEVKRAGIATVYGNMAHEVQIEDRQSPLMLKLAKLAKAISRFGYIGGTSIVILFMFQMAVINNNFDINLITAYFSDIGRVLSDFVEALILGIVVIVVAVPEGLPLMIAIVCSLNMKKMYKDNVLVRKLVGIETAGSLNILFSDKTGTITKGKPEVMSFITGNAKKIDKYANVTGEIKNILALSIIENSSAVRSNRKIIGGNATEKALMEYIGNTRLKADITKINQIPFSSDKKYSLSEVKGDYNLTLIKGAPEIVLKRCRYYYDLNGAKVLIKDMLYKLENEADRMANRAIRVLALAATEEKPKGDILPNNLTLIGLIGIRDEIRREAVAAISDVSQAGVQVVMITGDKRETAVSIAKEAGILKSDSDICLTSEELSNMTDNELKEKISNICVISRALPTDKSRLVRVAQSMNLVVGMTGDGVNDAPALKQADVGFAMGSGTSVAQEAGDIVILDDNFLSIKKAILYGRTIYNSIKKFITFQLTINIAAVSVSVFGPILGIKKPLDITQMLWINLVMDTLAAIAFGGEPSLRKYLFEKPKSRDENIIDKNMWSAIISNGLFICLLSMIIFLTPAVKGLFRNDINDIYFYTGYFTFFIFICIFNGFNARVDSIDLMENLSINKNFMWIMGFIVVVQVLMTYYGGIILRTQGLTFGEWITVLSFAVLIIPIDMLRKILLNNPKKTPKKINLRPINVTIIK